MEQSDIQVEERIQTTFKEPGKWAVLFLNDDKTPMDFVIKMLIEHFQYNKEQAYKMMNDIHENGKGIVAIYPFEIAEQKATEVKVAATQLKYPLQVKIELA
jgi:ATP-dependent Clp protease adaptor protein ClpS|tara:strand:- start:680 stop:982 length:303 start_codon:yes stop_codon:yes gene_type:complete